MVGSIAYFIQTLALALGAVIAVGATAVPVVEREVHAIKMKRDVWVPPITSPAEGTVWKVGDTVQVTWYVLLYTHKLAYL